MSHDRQVGVLERDEILESLMQDADAARAGESRMVFIAGEAGAGKTTLVEELRSRLVGVRWLWGVCDGSYTPRPLGPLFDIADQVGGRLPAVCRSETPREQIFRALLDELTAPAPLNVVVVEDVHWADEATLDLLRFLGRRPTLGRTLLLVTYRDDGLARDHPLRAAVGELATNRSARRVSVPPLSPRAVDVLARGTGVPASELYQLTGGNPFFVTEVLRGGAGSVPVSAREAVLARIAGMSAGARSLVDAAAVIGTRIELDVLRRVVDANADAIDECLTAAVLVSDAEGLRFRHEIARLAVEQELPAHRRSDLHRRALDALLAIGCTDEARLAHHGEGAADREAVLRHAPRAARRAAELAAHREAIAQFERALRFADGLDPAARAALHDGVASEAALIDSWAQAADERQAALALWRAAGDQVRVGDTLRLMSRPLWRLCRGAEADAAAKSALEVLKGLPPTVELAWAHANMAQQLVNGTDDEEGIEHAVKARKLAERLGDNAVLSEALNTEGFGHLDLGRLDQAVALLGQALDVGLAADLPPQVGRAYANLHSALIGHRRHADADHVFAEAVPYCDERDLGTWGTCLRGARTLMLVNAGRWDEAEQLCLDVLDHRHPSPVNQLNPLNAFGRIRARRGDAAAAAEALDAVLAMSERLGETPFKCDLRISRAEAAWLAGRVDEAVQEARLGAQAATHIDPWQRGALASWLRRCRVGDVDLSPVAEPYAKELAGDWREAAAMWHDLGCPYDEALALLDSRDENALREAVRLLDELGATATVAAAKAAMRRLGFRAIPRGPRPATRSDRFGLTRREQEVLALICADMTNAEIAEKLFISEKTVDHHVSAVLAKMGVTSRHAAARKAS